MSTNPWIDSIPVTTNPINFTNGYGTFPERMPDFDTAFVFIDDEYNNPIVPPWAIKLILQRDEI